jgi:hypothetical protein
VGRPAHPWRSVEARIRDRRVDGFQVHDPTSWAAIADLADIPAQPGGRYRGNRSVPVPTLTFECLFAFLVVGHGRRQLLWFALTRNPTAEWLAQQIVEAFPWDTAPSYLLRDNDRAYGQAFASRLRAMGIRLDKGVRAFVALVQRFGRLAPYVLLIIH